MTTLNFDADHTDHHAVLEALAQAAFDHDADDTLDFEDATDLYGGDEIEDAIADMGEDEAIEIFARRLAELSAPAHCD